jgi:hypothetical protein
LNRQAIRIVPIVAVAALALTAVSFGLSQQVFAGGYYHSHHHYYNHHHHYNHHHNNRDNRIDVSQQINQLNNCTDSSCQNEAQNQAFLHR